MDKIERIPGLRMMVEVVISSRDPEDIRNFTDDVIEGAKRSIEVDRWFPDFTYSIESVGEPAPVELLYNDDEENDNFTFIGIEEI